MSKAYLESEEIIDYMYKYVTMVSVIGRDDGSFEVIYSKKKYYKGEPCDTSIKCTFSCAYIPSFEEILRTVGHLKSKE